MLTRTGVTAVIFIALVALAQPQPQDEAKGWRGLVPLRATRRDVEGLLGSPQTAGGSSFEKEDAWIHVEYSDGPCEKGWPYGWNVEKDTVVSIYVSPKEFMVLQDLHLDQKKYQMSRFGGHNSKLYYVNQNEGISIQVDDFTERVRAFIYGPTSADSALECPDAANRLPVGRGQADSLFKFDVYGDLAPAGERERLDGVAAQVKGWPGTEVYLIAYAGQIARKGEAAARASCARDYLIGKHRIDPARIRAIDGGYQESLTVEVYIEEKDGDVPLARPTVRPSKVQITKEPTPKCALRAEN
jgi:hypothetical protein